MLKRKIYAFCAILGMIAGSAGAFTAVTRNDFTVAAIPFTDVPADSWYYPYVSYLSANNVVKGLTATEYVPAGNVTVAEAAAVITRYLGLEAAASSRKASMEMLGIVGCDKWYAGYVQLMHEAGIIDVTKYGCNVSGNSVSIVDPSFLQMPVKRYEFASFIIRSFELGGTQIRTANGTTGSEFIFGGAYDESALDDYIPYINDYSTIPSSYNYYVLKAYYNGIFNGDNLGNFNPMNNLSRAEMAKVITVIIDQTQRTRIQIPDSKPAAVGYMLSDDSYFVYKNTKYLKSDVSDSILAGEFINSVTIATDANGLCVSYKPSNYYPQGYDISLRHYRKQQSGFSKDITLPGADGTYFNYMTNGDVLVMILKETASGKVVDAYEVKLNGLGFTENSHCNYLP